MELSMAEPSLAVSEDDRTLSVPFERTGYLDVDVNITCAYTAGIAVPGTCRT